jgi:hypothetical protein
MVRVSAIAVRLKQMRTILRSLQLQSYPKKRKMQLFRKKPPGLCASPVIGGPGLFYQSDGVYVKRLGSTLSFGTGRRNTASMQERRNNFEYEDLLACGAGKCS